MTANLRDSLVARIRERGPIRFGEYVDAALYDPSSASSPAVAVPAAEATSSPVPRWAHSSAR
jgi:hypothetical protein